MKKIEVSYTLLFITSFVLFLLLTFSMTTLDVNLKNSAAPLGIVSYQFCGFTQSCQMIIDSWVESEQKRALLQMGLDYLYLFIYPLSLASAVLLANPKTALDGFALRTFGVCIVMGGCDAIENYALIRMLLDNVAHSPWPMTAGVFATIKFFLLALVLLKLVYFLIERFIKKRLV